MSPFEVFILTLVAATAVLAVYDIYLYRNHLPTISLDTARVAQHAPIVAAIMGLVVGILFGHFYWQMCTL